MTSPPLNINEYFGQAVRARRQELGISQEELGARSGLHRTYIADVERGKRNISLLNIEKIADALDLKISALFTSYEGGRA